MAAAHPAPSPTRPQRLRREREGRLLGGVCTGLARHLGVDPLLVRVVFVAAAAAGGFGVGVYALLWLLLPEGSNPAPVRRLPTGRAGLEVGLGAGLLLLSALLALRQTGLWLSDPVVWPLVLVVAGGALLWRQSLGGATDEAEAEAPPPSPSAAEEPRAADAQAARHRLEVLSRSGVGVALVVAAGLAFLQSTGALSAARDVLLAAVAVAVVLTVIFAPWIVRLVRSLASERASRVRSQERAEMAAHLHDSVLQTLALVQRRADDPAEVATLARRQERELRAWLAGRAPGAVSTRLAAALEAAADDVEQAHRVPVEVVAVGDAELDGAGEALVAAAREAMVNAAKFGSGSAVSVFAEVRDDELQVFVRDRGAGFDPAAVPADRRGVRESIVGRMQRHGGRAAIHPSPAGTEVELALPRSAS
ncbi:MAG TPA: PspC domain-containing protein [Solirubrobacteraceae bacterium]|nr:PspC domain-containing protein [Solirubrobacteraceae bacterium]